jgi:hypothetical protein
MPKDAGDHSGAGDDKQKGEHGATQLPPEGCGACRRKIHAVRVLDERCQVYQQLPAEHSPSEGQDARDSRESRQLGQVNGLGDIALLAGLFKFSACGFFCF